MAKKQKIKQQIVATLIVSFMAIMIAGSVEIKDTDAIGTNTTLIANLIGGALSVETPPALSFNNISLGVAINSLANLEQVNARDYRGTGLNWSVTASMNNLRTAGAGQNELSNAIIYWAPGASFADNGSNTGTAVGSTGDFSALRTLFNTSVNNGMGNYKITNTVINIVYGGSTQLVAGNYQNMMTMTIQ